jgi:hypothetical protein
MRSRKKEPFTRMGTLAAQLNEVVEHYMNDLKAIEAKLQKMHLGLEIDHFAPLKIDREHEEVRDQQCGTAEVYDRKGQLGSDRTPRGTGVSWFATTRS